jgi:hypothetical protein
VSACPHSTPSTHRGSSSGCLKTRYRQG